MIAYPRTALADELVHQLQGKAAFGDAHNGLFLAAPRRTAKTTFFRGDLTAALVRAGVVVVYVDLWADATRDAGVLIADAIGRALLPHLGLMARTAKKAGLDKVSPAGWLNLQTATGTFHAVKCCTEYFSLLTVFTAERDMQGC